MSAVGFVSHSYSIHCQSARLALCNAARRCCSLTSGSALVTALKIVSCAMLIIPAIVFIARFVITTNLRYSKALDAFCKKHSAFSGLLQKAQDLVAVENFNPLWRTDIATRIVYVGKDLHGGNQLFIKTPGGKRVLDRQPRAKNEQLAFLISHRLSLGVVPPTMTLEGYRNEIESIFPRSILKQLKILKVSDIKSKILPCRIVLRSIILLTLQKFPPTLLALTV